MSDPQPPSPPGSPDVDVLARVLDGLRSLPEQTRRVVDDGSGTVDPAAVPAVPLPRRRRID